MNDTVVYRSEMEADLEVLVRLLAESHPDPFAAVGGGVNFYRLVDEIRQALPDHLDTIGYRRLLRPLVASLRDGHTTIQDEDANPVRHLSVDFTVMAEGLTVGRMEGAGPPAPVGAWLEAVNDVPVDQLVAAVERTWGSDNQVHAWCRLADALDDPGRLAEVLGSTDVPRLTLAVRTVDGSTHDVPAGWCAGPRGPGGSPPSAVALPAIGPAQIGWGFADESRRVAIWRIGRLTRYREAAEVWRHSGFHDALASWYGEVHPGSAPSPAALAAFVSETPPATPIIAECLDAMARAGTKWVVIDLTEATGGNSVLANMLGWALFGPDAMSRVDAGYQIPRYSPLYAQNYGTIPEGDWGPGGYDFSEERAWRARRASAAGGALPERAHADAWMGEVPTFEKAVPQLAKWRPEVVVVTGARTYSAGFDILLTLRALGAHHVGVPSSQAPNCFIDVLRFTLPHSRTTGTVSFKRSVALPALAPHVRHLDPEVALTYPQFQAYHFDPAASVRLALDTIQDGRWRSGPRHPSDGKVRLSD